MVMKYLLPKFQRQEPHEEMVYFHIQDICRDAISVFKNSPQPTGFCITWDLTKLDGNNTNLQTAFLNKTLKKLPAKSHFCDLLSLNSEAIEVRRTRYVGYIWRKRGKLTSDFSLSIYTERHTSVNRPVKTHIHQLCAGTGCRLQNLPWTIVNRNR